MYWCYILPGTYVSHQFIDQTPSQWPLTVPLTAVRAVRVVCPCTASYCCCTRQPATHQDTGRCPLTGTAVAIRDTKRRCRYVYQINAVDSYNVRMYIAVMVGIIRVRQGNTYISPAVPGLILDTGMWYQVRSYQWLVGNWSVCCVYRTYAKTHGTLCSVAASKYPLCLGHWKPGSTRRVNRIPPNTAVQETVILTTVELALRNAY